MSETNTNDALALAAENEKMRGEIARLKSDAEILQAQLRDGRLEPKLAQEVQRRMEGGLSREDALECGRNQLRHNERLEKIADLRRAGQTISDAAPHADVAAAHAALKAKPKK